MGSCVVINNGNPIVVVAGGGGHVTALANSNTVIVPTKAYGVITNDQPINVTMNQGAPGPAGQDGALFLPPPDDPDKTILSFVNGSPTWVYPEEANVVAIENHSGTPVDFDTDVDGGSILP